MSYANPQITKRYDFELCDLIYKRMGKGTYRRDKKEASKEKRKEGREKIEEKIEEETEERLER